MKERDQNEWYKVVHGTSCRTIQTFQEKNREEMKLWITDLGGYDSFEELPDGHILVWN